MFKSYYKNSFIAVRYFTCIVFLLLLAFNSVLAIPDWGDLKTDSYGLKGAAEQSGFKTNQGTGVQPVAEFIGKAVGWVLSLLGVIFVVLIIYSGYMWILAMGNEENAKKAKDIMVNAVIGIVIVFTAYALTNFLIKNLHE
jgi:hypothetical protein